MVETEGIYIPLTSRYLSVHFIGKGT